MTEPPISGGSEVTESATVVTESATVVTESATVVTGSAGRCDRRRHSA